MDEFRGMMRPEWLAAYPVIAFEDLSLERLMPELLKERVRDKSNYASCPAN